MNTNKHIILFFLIVSISFCSKIIDDTLKEIKEVFPNYISIKHSKHQISKSSTKNIQNTVRQKFFRSDVNLWIVNDNDSLTYYCILDNVKGKSLPITFLTIFDNFGKVHHVSIIKYREGYGSEVGNRRWLNQFINYNDSSIYKVSNDISSISGATISVHSVTKGIRKLSYLIHEIIKDNE